MNATKPPPKPKVQPNRSGEPQSFYLPAAQAEAMRRFIASQEFEPSKTDMFIRGLELFLATKGYWPPPRGREEHE